MLFLENGNKFTYKEKMYIGSGVNGRVVLLDNGICLKTFIDNFYPHRDDIIKLIRDKKYNNVYEIYDLLYDKHGNFEGYTMKYYPSDNSSVLDSNSMFLRVTKDLNNLIKEFTNDSIYVKDLSRGNIIYTKDTTTLIDCDLFKIENSIDSVWFNNMIQYKQLVFHILRKEFINRYAKEYLDKGYSLERLDYLLKDRISTHLSANFSNFDDYINSFDSPKELIKTIIK